MKFFSPRLPTPRKSGNFRYTAFMSRIRRVNLPELLGDCLKAMVDGPGLDPGPAPDLGEVAGRAAWPTHPSWPPGSGEAS